MWKLIHPAWIQRYDTDISLGIKSVLPTPMRTAMYMYKLHSCLKTVKLHLTEKTLILGVDIYILYCKQNQKKSL